MGEEGGSIRVTCLLRTHWPLEKLFYSTCSGQILECFKLGSDCIDLSFLKRTF